MKNLPEPFLKRMKTLFSEKEFSAFTDAIHQDFFASIRYNPKKETAVFGDSEQVAWNEYGRILKENRRFITDPLWHAGAYYVQEPSSMILRNVFHQIYQNQSPKRALDLCAAPGGKSTLLQGLLDESAVLIANEVIKPRAMILKENHIRSGISENLLITQNDPSDFTNLREFFDYIQMDAACSGEGMFRKDIVAINEWSETNCQYCSERQKRILSNVLPALCNEGILVYSTCTFNPDENEKLMNWAVQNFGLESLPLQFDSEWGIQEVQAGEAWGYYFYPHKVKGEGLFLSVLRKKSGFGLQNLHAPEKSKPFFIPELIKNDYFHENNGKIFLKTPTVKAVRNAVKEKLKIIYTGIEAGEMKGKDFIPSEALALFHNKLHTFPEVELNLQQALHYLRGNDPELDLNKKGFYLMTYGGFGLGWIKFLGNRSNNYYPKPWRIRNY